MASSRERLDVLLVHRELLPSRSQAQSAIQQQLVLVNGEFPAKSSQQVPVDAEIRLLRKRQFVSRGGLKLQAALTSFDLSFHGSTVLDVGASTGGFTDCALQAGACHVTCVDVGHGQLHTQLQADLRVVSLERVNARELPVEKLPFPQYDRIVVDLSFISVKLVLAGLWPLLANHGFMIVLVKPQFEAGRTEVSRGKGIIGDDVLRRTCLDDVIRFANSELSGLLLHEWIECPITGGDGNREFLLLLARK